MKRLVLLFLLGAMASNLGAVQVAVPTEGSTWSNNTFIVEAPPGDNSTVRLAPLGDTLICGVATSTVETGLLSTVTDPVSSSGHTLYWEAGVGSGSTIIELYSGVTLITQVTSTGSSSDSYTLSAAEANLISDYSNLYIFVYNYTVDDSVACACDPFCTNVDVFIDFVRLVVPDAPVGGGARRVLVVE
jgi:hypothetical protein